MKSETPSSIEVTVIIPNYNGVNYLANTVKSAITQSIGDIEVLIVDDGSTDDSLEVLKSIRALDSRVKVFSTEGGLGPARARNLAIEKANGRYIAFLDADDFWLPNKLKIQINEMQRQGAAISCHAVGVVDDIGKSVGKRIPLPLLRYGDLVRSTVVTSSVVIDRVLVGDFRMPDISRRQDLALWLEVVRNNGPMLGIQSELGVYRVHDTSYSRNKLVSAYYTWLVLRNVEKMPLYKSTYYFFIYALKGLFGRVRGIN